MTRNSQPELARRLGLFDATMIVMGGIIGSGIFMNPAIVARQVHTPFLVLGTWVLGGLFALAAAFIWAELATRRPEVGGQYAYLREAFHPLVAFVYGWVLLLVIQTGGMAAVAVTFSRYFVDSTKLPISYPIMAAVVLAILTIINCLGVRAGGTLQSVLMVLKIVALAGLVVCGLFLGNAAPSPGGFLDRPASLGLLTAFGVALVPVIFSYGGWQTATFVAGEIKEPGKNLPRGLILGVIGVVVLYLAANVVYLRVLGVAGLAASTAPASDAMRTVLGNFGARAIAAAIAISTIGFLSQSMLTAPRVYFAMANDGLFFKSVGAVHPRTRAPIVAIALQGLLAIFVALRGTYESILNYVVSVDAIFFGLTACCVFVLSKRPRVPGHPFTTIVFIAVCWLIAINTVYQNPQNTLIGVAIMLAGIPVYWFWRWRSSR
ncbi:MAG TPA: amino acid permease [Pyrinomonadaceae bacterium]|jgi:APA family basic amino acid/polyamine antiporter|nr:amino acid permease [Pyrinomonadaceae bacterium]